MNNHGRHSAYPSWVEPPVLYVLCTVVVATQEHTHVPKVKKGSAEQLPVGQTALALRGERVLQGLAVGGLHACVICEGEVVHSCPPGFR